MQSNSRLTGFVLRSPFFLILFLIIPGALILSRLLHFHLPFTMTTNLLLGNNIFMLIALLTRLQHYLAGLRRGTRYGADLPRHAASLDIERPCARVREELAGAGFRFDGDGSYGEKRDPGYLGTTLLYGGLVAMLSFGIWDNLRQFSGTVIKGPGAAIDLSQADKYYHLIAGPLASPAGVPLLKVTKQVFPDTNYPLGATEIMLYARDGKKVGGAFIDANKDPYRFNGYDIYLNSLLVDCALTIKTRGSDANNIFDDAVKLMPLYGNKVGDFTLYGTFTTPAGDDGEAFYDPTHNVFRIALTHGGKKVLETDFEFQKYRQKEAGDHVVSILGMGHWSEIHVVRRRNMFLIVVGAIIAAIGLVMRIFFRPQRVWLKEAGEGCRVRFVGSETKRLLQAEG